MQKRLSSLFAMLTVFTFTALAQVTTSGINGKVVASGEEVVGATVTATHEPSGTRYNAVTNAKGRYSIQGMRVGGPYKITITYIGYKEKDFSDVYLSLGDASSFNATLEENANELGELTVTATQRKQKMGAGDDFGRNAIENAPTVNRNIYDVAKLSPLVNLHKEGGITIVGSSNRYNSFQIDGMVSNDVFGLSDTGTNGGQAGGNPISMDAIQEIQVVASPFDITQSGFTGGAINAVTKSGTNEFRGTAYTYFSNEKLYGTWNQNTGRKEKIADESTNTYGFTFGGPIVKDKLFFFTNLEYKKHSYPSDYYPSSNYFLSTDVAQKMVDHYKEVTGISDSFNQRDINDEDVNVLARLDWNINTNNKFSLRYQYNNAYSDVYESSSYVYYFNSSTYKMKNHTHSIVAELNSHIGNSLYNELRAGVTLVRDKRDVPYQGPNVYISDSGNYICLGTEYASGANFINQDIWTFEDNLSWYLGDHTFTFGTHNEIYNIDNLYIQYCNGGWYYNSIDNFLNDRASTFYYNWTDENVAGSTRWAVPFKAGIFGLYAQDKWNISTRFQLTYGVRFDMPVYFNDPTTNDEFNASDFAGKFGPKVGHKPYSNVMFSPRVGFRWHMNESRTSLLRGGAGIFNGRAPFVWVQNAWGNTGMENKGTTINANSKTGTWAPSFNQYANDPVAAANSASGSYKPTINTVSYRFRFPQVFRANIAWEQKLPGGIEMTLEALYSKNLNNVWFENLALNPNGKVYAVNSNYENSATTYYSSTPGSYYSIINITNTDKGHSYSLGAQLKKSFAFGIDLAASYTFGHSYSVNDGTSSVAYSNWSYCFAVDPAKQVVSYSMFDKPHHVTASATYNSPRYGKSRFQTHATLTYNGYSGQRYSLAMSDGVSASFNGDYRRGNSLLYIPTDAELEAMTFVDVKNTAGEVTTTAAQGKAAFKEWIENDSYASSHRGQYAKRNGAITDFENHFDLHIAQDFYYLKERGSKIELTFDIINLSNLLNKKWGTYYSYMRSLNILNVAGTTADASGNRYATYTFVGQTPSKENYDSRWHMQIGLRVTF